MRKSSANVRFSLRERIHDTRSFWSYSSRMTSSWVADAPSVREYVRKTRGEIALAERDACAGVELLERHLAGKQRRDLHDVERAACARTHRPRATRSGSPEGSVGRRLHHPLLRLLRGRERALIGRVEIRRAAEEERNDVGRREAADRT